MRLSRVFRGRRSRRALPLVVVADVPRAVERMVFVCGLHRSGTTLAAAWLHAMAEVAILEAPVPESEGQHLQDVYPSAARQGGPGRFAFSAAMNPEPPPPAEARAARARLIACWSTWVVGDEPVLLEKSPPNLTRIAWLRAVFPGAGFLIVTRDPRATAMATVKWSRKSPADLVGHWAAAHEAAAAALGPDCHHLRYEDFCADPASAIGGAIRALGLTERQTPLPLAARHARPVDSNAAYIAAYPGEAPGPGVWERFGYAPAAGATSATPTT